MLINRIFKSFLLIFLSATVLLANEEVANVNITKDAVILKAISGINKYSLTISGPEAYYMQKECNAEDVLMSQFISDGVYKYELVEYISLTQTQSRMSDAQRHAATDFVPLQSAKKQYGHFNVVAGKPLVPTDIEEK